MAQICHSISMFSSKALVVVACILLACSQASNPPQLPIYVGQSYSVVDGSPFSNTIDPGFIQLIFNEVYSQNKTTSDGKYSIPDDIQSRVLSQCSLTTDPSVFRGSQSYQNALKTRADLTLGYHGYITSSAFVFSKDYKDLQVDTITNNKSKTYATANCKSYELSIDLNNIKRLKVNFKDDVKRAVEGNSWTNFIEKYGTHFTYEVVMGSRVTQQSTFTYEAVSKLNSVGVDLKLAARADFAKTYNDSTFDWHHYQNQINYANKFLASRKTVKIGGVLPAGGNIKEWAINSANEPQPISYKLTDLSVLFKLINDTDFNATKAAELYKAGMEEYCRTKKCPSPVQDRPNPPKATTDVKETKHVGSGGGTAFSYKRQSTTLAASKMVVRSSTVITNIQIHLSDGVQTVISPAYGGVGGNLATWVVPAGEHIQKVNVSHSGQINSLAFITDKNTRSPVYGRFAGSHEVLEFPAGYQMVGITGRSGAELDQIGFFIRKTIVHYQNDSSNSIESQNSQGEEEEEEVKLIQLNLTSS